MTLGLRRRSGSRPELAPLPLSVRAITTLAFRVRNLDVEPRAIAARAHARSPRRNRHKLRKSRDPGWYIRRVIPTWAIPQANDLDRVRRAVEAVARGRATTAAVARSMRAQPRQAAYALDAARAIGLLDDTSRLTRSGTDFVATGRGTVAELELLRTAIAGSRVVTEVVPELLDAHASPTITSIASRLARQGLSVDTARRRASTLLAWRKTVIGGQLVLPGSAATELEPELQSKLQTDNPWWRGEAGPVVPAFERDLVAAIRRRLETRIAPVIVVRGPRQVGKTTAQQQLIERLLRDGVAPRNILRVQFDDLPSLRGWQEPILRIVEWYERAILARPLNELARRGEKTYLFFDEVQNLADWAIQLKSLVDSKTTQVVVTGSSALRIEAGKDSLAGRIASLEVGTLSLTEITRLRGESSLQPFHPENGVDVLARKEFWTELAAYGRKNAAARDAAFAHFSARGGYPLAHARADVQWPFIAQQLNETVIDRVIDHDLRVGDRGRKRDPQLLKELFRLACRYAGQSPDIQLFVRETQRALGANVGAQRVRQYLQFLDRALLIRLIEPLEIRLKKARGAPKICLADHALRASWLGEEVPLEPSALVAAPHLTDLAGRIAESATGAYLSTIGGVGLAHFPMRPSEPEIDFVVTVATHRTPIEVKYRRRIGFDDTEGLRTFIEKSAYHAPFGVLVTQTDDVVIDDPRIVTIPLSSLLLLR